MLLVQYGASRCAHVALPSCFWEGSIAISSGCPAFLGRLPMGRERRKEQKKQEGQGWTGAVSRVNCRSLN